MTKKVEHIFRIGPFLFKYMNPRNYPEEHKELREISKHVSVCFYSKERVYGVIIDTQWRWAIDQVKTNMVRWIAWGPVMFFNTKYWG